jgi:hypothetical protein
MDSIQIIFIIKFVYLNIEKHSLTVHQRGTLKEKCMAKVNLEIEENFVIKIEYSIIELNIYENYTIMLSFIVFL